MYKKALSVLAFLNVIFLGCFLGVMVSNKDYDRDMPLREMQLDGSVLSEVESSGMGIATKASSGQRIVSFHKITRNVVQNISEEDYGVLLRIVEAEAGCEDINGKILVANVILNRTKHKQFPDTITEVVFQQEGNVTQFSPVANGRYYTVQISASTVEAVERTLNGEDLSKGALYFAARKYADQERMQWFDEKLEFLFEYGGHEFFR